MLLKAASFALVSTFVLVPLAKPVLASDDLVQILAEENEATSLIIFEKIETTMEGLPYSWMITAEEGKLGEAFWMLNMTRTPNSDWYKGGTVAILEVMEEEDNDRINLLLDTEGVDYRVFDRIEIPYIYSEGSQTLEIPEGKTTGTFNSIIKDAEAMNTTVQTKGDNEQNAYVTFTSINLGGGGRLQARVSQNGGENGSTPFVVLQGVGTHPVAYQFNGGQYQLRLAYEAGTPGASATVAGRWTP